MKLSCTTVMLPRWTLDETFDKLAEYGFEGVELRVRDTPDDPNAEPAFWGRHLSDVSPTNVEEKAPQIRAAAQRSGLPVVAFAPRVLIDEDELLRKLCRGAVAVDPNAPPMIRVGAPRHDRTAPYQPQFDQARAGFERAAELAAEYGVKVLYEIHTGTVAVSASRAFELLRNLDPQNIGAIYDVPNMVRVGLEDTRMGMELLNLYLAHCHIGNGMLVQDGLDDTGAIVWKWDFCDLRRGAADIAQIVADLRSVGYDDYLSLEEFGPGDDDEKIRSEAEYLKPLLGAPC